MDEEDLADATEAQKIETSQAFAGLGSSSQPGIGSGGLMGIFRATGDSMGTKLLRRMGWKDGQGIGPKIRRRAQLDMQNAGASASADFGGETYLFAPENAPMVQFVRKTDRKGLGHHGESRLPALRQDIDEEDEDESSMSGTGRNGTSLLTMGRPKPKTKSGGIGVGILNDDGSDEEDPYEIGPKIKYNRVIGGDKKKKKKKGSAASNPALGSAPVFLPKNARAGGNLRRCHDGRLPLEGFVLAKFVEDLTSVLSQYAPPPVPQGWVPSRKLAGTAGSSSYVSTADAAKASSHDARSRAAILGEKALPGKSVFDYISASTREKLAAASGNSNLPAAGGEIPHELAMSAEDRQHALREQIPKLDRETALAAIIRSAGGPYADDGAKRARFRTYLESQANPGQPLPDKPSGVRDEDFLREMTEFYNCARIFKPMTGFMASRFTTAKTTTAPADGDATGTDLISTPEPKVVDPAEEAAKMGMFGPMTRKVEDFLPTRLLCKRFNVKAPAHSRPDNESGGGPQAAESWSTMAPDEASQPGTAKDVLKEDGPKKEQTFAGSTGQDMKNEPDVNPDSNEAVEGKTAHADVLRAIFGDSDSE